MEDKKSNLIEIFNSSFDYKNDKMDSILQSISGQTVAFDVDQTLVMWDDKPFEPGPGKLKFTMPGNNKIVYLKPHNKHIFVLKTYIPRGFNVIVWSAAGVEWVEEVIKVLCLEKNVNLIMSKICLFYDDLPAEQVLGEHLYFHDSIDGEEWRNINGYEGRYQVSHYGRIRKINQFGDYSIKKIQINNSGYPSVQLHNGEKNVIKQVHRLVAKAFIPENKNKKIVNHIDGNKMNNNVYNLEWVTSSENRKKRIKTPKFNTQSGELNSSAKLKQTQVIEIYKRAKNGESLTKIAKDYQITDTSVSYIKNKRSWKQITDQFDKFIDKSK